MFTSVKLTATTTIDAAKASQTALLASIAPHFAELVVANNAPEKIDHDDWRRQRRFEPVLSYEAVAI